MEAGKEERKGSFASVVMIAAIAVLIVLIGLKAVSYTHLDVYKRQSLRLWATR